MKSLKELVATLLMLAVFFAVMGVVHIGLAFMLSGQLQQPRDWRFATTAAVSFLAGAYSSLYLAIWFRGRNCFTTTQKVKLASLGIGVKSAVVVFAFYFTFARQQVVAMVVACVLLCIFGAFVGADFQRKWNRCVDASL